LAAVLIALGLLFSAATQNQVLAAMAAMAGGSLWVLVKNAPAVIGGRLGHVLSSLAILDHYALFRRGILDTRTLFFLGITTGMLLFLAVRVVESRRWKFGVTPGAVPAEWVHPTRSLILLFLSFLALAEAHLSWFSRGFWSTYNTSMVVLGLLFAAWPAWQNHGRLRYELGRRQTGIALTVLLNCLLVFAIWGMAVYLSSRFYVRYDWTASRHYTLSAQTLSVISQINTPVEIVTTLHQPVDLAQEIHDLLDEYKARTKYITITSLDPLRSPEEMDRLRQRYHLTTSLSDDLLVTAGGQAWRIPRSALFYQEARVLNGVRIPGPVQFVGEAEITSAIIQVTRGVPGGVAFLSGHGERAVDDAGNEGLSRAAAELGRSGWMVKSQVITPGAS
ncbi:MAG TPA: Gldg family protein, partial [bacterium]|nr:Gldg family protein [bacterium]